MGSPRRLSLRRSANRRRATARVACTGPSSRIPSAAWPFFPTGSAAGVALELSVGAGVACPSTARVSPAAASAVSTPSFGRTNTARSSSWSARAAEHRSGRPSPPQPRPRAARDSSVVWGDSGPLRSQLEHLDHDELDTGPRPISPNAHPAPPAQWWTGTAVSRPRAKDRRQRFRRGTGRGMKQGRADDPRCGRSDR